MALNKVMLIGRVGKDPEILRTKDGKKFADFSLATSEAWKDKNTGEKREKTEWHNIVVYNEGLAGVLEKYVHKGSKIYVEGALQTRKWQDKDGKDRYTTEVVLQGFGSQLILLGDKNSQSDNAQRDNRQQDAYNYASVDNNLDDDIPF